MAIAFGVKTESTNSTQSIVTPADNPVLLLAIRSTSATPGAPTYAASLMSLVLTQKENTSNQWLHVFIKQAPATGSNTLAINDADMAEWATLTYSGAKQTAQPDASLSAESSGTSTTCAVTTVANNSWVVIFGISNANFSSATSFTNRTTVFNGLLTVIGDSDAAITPAGVTSMTANWNTSANSCVIQVSIAPAVAVGPANVKTYDGLAAASVKTVNGLAIASVKTFNGLA